MTSTNGLKIKFPRLLPAILLFFSALGFSAGLAAAPYTIGMSPWIANVPLNVAMQNGYWNAEGVEVVLYNYTTSQELIDAVKAGKVDLGVDMIGSWAGLYQDGVDVVVLGETDWSHGGDKIVLQPGLKPADLKGKRVAIYLDRPSVTVFLNEFLTKNGLAWNDVERVEVDDEKGMVDHFIAKKFAAIIQYEPEVNRAVEVGKGTVLATTANYPGIMPEGFGALKSRVKTIPHQDLVKIFRGWFKGVAFVADAKNFNVVHEIALRGTFADGDKISAEDLKRMFGTVKIHNAADAADQNGATGGLATYLGNLRAFLKKTDQLKRDFAPADLMNTGALLEAAGKK